MSSNNRIARLAGILFLVPLLAYGTGSVLIADLTGQPDLPAAVQASSASFITGALLLFLNSFTVAAIGIVLFPVLGRYGPAKAVAYLVTRLSEALILVVGLVFLLLLLPVNGDSVDAGIAELLVRGNYYAYQLAMIALGTGSVFFCLLLYRARLIPRWAAAWGMAGYAFLAIGAVLELFGLPVGVLLSLPGGLFELFLGLLLIVKGFSAGQKPA
jgi:hypothetical protein